MLIKKLRHIYMNCPRKQKCTNKYTMKAKVSISDSKNSDNRDDTNFLTFFVSSNVVNPPTATSDDQELTIEDEEDELLDS